MIRHLFSKTVSYDKTLSLETVSCYKTLSHGDFTGRIDLCILLEKQVSYDKTLFLN